MASENRTPIRRFLGLDFLRGWAALAVIAFHVKHGPSAIFGSNYLWVDFFFLLSGFVLYPRLSTSVSSATFLKARFLRLFPIALVALSFSLFLETVSFIEEKISHHAGLTPAFGATRPLWSIFFAMALAQIIVPVSTYWVGALWSLSAEWWANILAATLKVANSTGRAYLMLALGLIAAMYNFTSHVDRGALFGISLLGRALVGFTIGMLLRKSFERQPRQENSHLPIALFVIVPLLIWTAWRYSPTLGWFAAELLFPVLIWYFATLRNPNSKSLSEKISTNLGRLSFGIYAYQQAVYELLTLVLRKTGNEITWEWTIVVLVLGSVSLSFLSNRFVEPRLAPLFAKLVRVKTGPDTL